jgi:hypothetical protein
MHCTRTTETGITSVEAWWGRSSHCPLSQPRSVDRGVGECARTERDTRQLSTLKCNVFMVLLPHGGAGERPGPCPTPPFQKYKQMIHALDSVNATLSFGALGRCPEGVE